MARVIGVLAASLLYCAVTSSAQFSAERAVSDPQYGPAAGDQTMPVVATNGSEFLVAWTDLRSYPSSIYANRVTADGHVLDGTGIRITIDSVQIVGLHFIGGSYTLLYTYDTFQSGVVSAHTGIAIISSDGKLIDGPRVILDEWAVPQSASNGSRIVFCTAHEFVAIDARGNVLARYAMPAQAFRIASNGTTFLAVGFTRNGSSSGEDLIALDANGKPGGMSHVDEIACGYGPFMASDGSDYLVVSSSLLASTAQRVSDRARIESTVTAAVGFANLMLTWTGSSYLGLAWTAEQWQTALVTFDRSGALAAPPRILGAGAYGVATAWNGSETMLIWMAGSGDAPYGFDISGAIGDATGTLRSSVITIPSSANAQRNVAAATSGSQDLVAWAEPGGIFAARLTAEGVPLDGRGITVATEGMMSAEYLASSGLRTVRAIDDGTTYLVAWGSNRTWPRDSSSYGPLAGPVKARRIARSGVLAGDTIELSPCSRTFDLVMGNDSPVLFHTPCSGEGLVAQRIGLTSPAGPPVVISNMNGADFPRAAWNGNEWLVVWNNLIESGSLIYPPEFRGDVYAGRLSAALTVIDTQPIPITDSQINNAHEPLVATDGHDFLVAWSWGGAVPSGMYTSGVRADGSTGDPVLIVAGSLETKSISWTGQRYAIAYATSSWDDPEEDLFLTHPGTHDQVVISATPTDERDASLIAPPGRPMRVVYTRVATEPVYGGVPRLFIRDEILPKRRSVRPR